MNKKIKYSKVEFKDYNQNQLSLLPPSLEDLIPKTHRVRIFNKYIDMVNIEILVRKYQGGGRPSYHPKMMLKILLYAYSEGIYSSRKIEKSVRENINYMWLAGGNNPDFRTINRFRKSKLNLMIEEVFINLNTLLIEEGYINLRDYYLDGTKIEADANKYSFIWRKNTKRYKLAIAEKLKNIYKEIEDDNDDEDKFYGEKNLEELGEEANISTEKIKKKVKELEGRLKDNPDNKKIKQAVKTIKNDLLPRYEKYEKQERDLSGRNSCSKTDKDATFMRRRRII